MKKTFLITILFIQAQISFGQAVIGTTTTSPLYFMINSTIRGRWTNEGPLIIGYSPTLPLSPETVSLMADSDAIMNGICYIHNSKQITSSAYDYKSTDYNSGAYAYISLCDYTKDNNLRGNMYLQSFKTGTDARPMILNPDGGHILAGTSTNLSYDELQVNGTTNMQGYVVAITTVTTDYNAVNSDYTILANASSYIGAMSIHIPISGINTGKVYVIKRIDNPTAPGNTNPIHVYGSGSATIDGQRPYDLTAQYQSIMVQFDGTNYQVLAKN